MMNQASSLSLLENLKQQGADRFDPVRFRYLESFEQRLRANGLQQGGHWRKLEQAISDYQARLEGAEQPRQAPAAPEPSPISSLLDRLNQITETPAEAPRSTLEQRVFGETSELEQTRTASSSNSPQPLKAMIRARADQGTQALQERIRHAIESTPKEAGPMNAHRLVSRALAEMQTLSPEYLERFARYTDTLLALERLAKRGLEKNL
ncbi:DUF2894 domain-containing protein [Marinobacter shengliensis]|jgi:hypothetical protein|uniref:DUF2894 domain-containing protein n=1 Tax=Marinobacter shengliensis TaxID=1389223 RepID=UPI0025736CC7|nr:DUF2894 domain-containing protein [Marinobacter shengliensis]BEH15651.1 hypothetical protein MAALD49_30190 [Marinobacter shengliensis]